MSGSGARTGYDRPVGGTDVNAEGRPPEVPAGEASPETLQRLEAALPGRTTPTVPDEDTRRALDRHAVLLLALAAGGILLGVVSVLALIL